MSIPNEPNKNPGHTLAQLIALHAGSGNGLETQIPRLTLHRWESPTEPTSYMLAPSICLIGQGRKRVFLGEDSFLYDAHQFLITSVELPVIAQIVKASTDRPYLGLSLELDLRVISELMLVNPEPPAKTSENSLGIGVSAVTEALLDAFHRLLRTLHQPEDIPTLAPLIQKEIFYRLLKSDQGARLRHIALNGNQGYQISRAIDWLKQNFKHSVKVEELAKKAGLSVSAFHHHFRAVTAMSPLQFQKRMRLNEARRLMLAGNMAASSAAFQVGYESASQFSREYSRLFGAPPIKDIRKLTDIRV